MKQLNIDSYRYYDPIFESVRVVLNQLGESYTPEYISGISGSAFKIAAGCPSRPTCVCDFWPLDFFKYMGYETTELTVRDKDGNDIYDAFIDAIKAHIDSGKAAVVWHAFREEEWDVVCGYDEQTKEFIGKGTLYGDCGRQSWDRPKNSNVYAFGAVLPGARIAEFDARAAEIKSIESAIAHARKTSEETDLDKIEGIQGYRAWAQKFETEGADRGVADSYCFDTYRTVRKAAVIYLRALAAKYANASAHLENAAASFAIEADELESAMPYLFWDSPWGVDEERSKKVAPILRRASDAYEQGIEHLEKALEIMR